MKEEIYTLDGKQNGMIAMYKGTSNMIRIPKPCYRNKLLLESELHRFNFSNRDFDIGFLLDGKYIPITKFQEITPGIYQAFINETIVNVIPIKREQIIKCGYFSFVGDPEEKITNHKEGIKINKKVYRALREATSYMVRTGEFSHSEQDNSITYMADINIAPLKYINSSDTCTFRLLRGFELVKINEIRKACGEYVIPFIGKLDKFKNIYFCFTKDKHEFANDYYDNHMQYIIDTMMNYLETNYPELNPNIINLDIKHQIIL